MKLLLEKFNFTINIEENKHTVIACEEQDLGLSNICDKKAI